MKKLEEMSLEELKVLFFDLQEQQQILSANLQALVKRINEVRGKKE